MSRFIRRHSRSLKLLGMAAFTLTLSGCAWMWGDLHYGRKHQSSTPLVGFLYTDGKVPEQNAQPELRLPIRVAVSFLPDAGGYAGYQPAAAEREKVLTTLRESFRSLPYVTEIVIIPDYYLHSGQGDGLMQIEQLSRLFNFDLFALVSYDQVQNNYQNDRSLAYLTIVGAFLVRGDRNETHTLLDVAVIDPKSRALVMRAGGISSLKGNTTAIDVERHTDTQSSRGFEEATSQLVANFRRELTDFEQRVRDGTASVKVVRQASKGGGGAMDPWLLAALALMAVCAARRSGTVSRKWGLTPFFRYWDSRVARNEIFGQRSIVSSRFTRDGARYTSAPE
jgi:rhombotail lipoprotein